MAGMIWLGVLALLALAGLAMTVAALERQMRSMARMLERREPTSLQRLALDLPTPGGRALAQAANALIDEADAARLEAAEERRALQENLAAFSHDVRTPLAGAQGYLQLYAVAEPGAERDGCVAAAGERLGVMRGLVDLLFEYAKADDGQAVGELVPTDAAAVAAECLAVLHPAFAARGWEPAVALAEDAPPARADRDALARIMENLLVNALRHGAAAPQVTLRGVSSGGGELIAVSYTHLTLPTSDLV